MTYSCGVCGSTDPKQYMRCNRPDCTDGREPDNPVNKPLHPRMLPVQDWYEIPKNRPLEYAHLAGIEARLWHMERKIEAQHRVIWILLFTTLTLGIKAAMT